MRDGLASLQKKNLDEESTFAEDEKAAALDDNSRYRIQFVIIFFSLSFIVMYHLCHQSWRAVGIFVESSWVSLCECD